MIELKSLHFSYNKYPWMQNLNLRIQPGTITALIGPNGSGKSTVLKLCAGLLRPQQGAVLLNGEDLRRIRPRERAKKLALLRQGAPPPPLAALDVVLSGRYPHRNPGLRYTARDRDLCLQAMRDTGCIHLRDQRMDRLSGGERQKVFMAAALAQDTGILLLDEPTAFLDIGASIAWMRFLRELNRQQHKTVVTVLHDLDLALRYCDHIAVLHRGALAACGTAPELLRGNTLHDIFQVDIKTFRENGEQYHAFA